MNKPSIALFLLKKKKKLGFSSQHNSDVTCVWHASPCEWQQGDMLVLGSSEDESFGGNREVAVASVFNRE